VLASSYASPSEGGASVYARHAQQLFDAVHTDDKILLTYSEPRVRLLNDAEHALVVADMVQWMARVVAVTHAHAAAAAASVDDDNDDRVVACDDVSLLASTPTALQARATRARIEQCPLLQRVPRDRFVAAQPQRALGSSGPFASSASHA
jgi:hypothetical protein